MRNGHRIPLLASLAGVILVGVSALSQAQETAFEPAYASARVGEQGISIQLDNDLFSSAVGTRDRDYSWGVTLTYDSPRPGRVTAPLHRARRGLASPLPQHESAAVSRATQFGVIAMTPEDLKASEALPDDRPYANLVFATASELRIYDSGDRSRFTSLTVGLLGTGLAESLQDTVHSMTSSVDPKGWGQQISDGGEPTARFALAEQWLIGDTETHSGALRQTKFTLGGSAGYLTEASAAVSMRWGRIHTPWWSFNPELGDYSPAPIAPVAGSSLGGSPELYGFVGARVKARAYNALLQGQFRHSDVRVASDDLARLQVEAWAGVTSAISEWAVTYSVHVASREIDHGPAARSLIWASLSLTRAF